MVSSCRTRSRVMPRSVPSSSSVCGGWPSRPKRRSDDVLHAAARAGRAPPRARPSALRVAVAVSGDSGEHVLDQVGDRALAVADRRLERDRIARRARAARATRSTVMPGLRRDLLDRRLAVELLRQLAARALHLAHLLGDVDREADRAALVGERARDRLADPPGRVGRELEAEPVVELLDRPDQAHVALLDQVEERHVGLRVVARDRHHEPEVRLDQALLGRLVAQVLAPGELALLRRRQQAAVAELADVELERVGAAEPLVLAETRVLRLLLVVLDLGSSSAGSELERSARARLGCSNRVERLPRLRAYRRRSPRLTLRDSVKPQHPTNVRPDPRIRPCAELPDTAFVPGSKLERTLAAQALLAAIAERGADAVGYAYRGARRAR